MMEMRHYFTVEKDGTVHVSNWVGAYEGQHHVHTKADFTRWKRNVSAATLKELKASPCRCGLNAGETREGRQ